MVKLPQSVLRALRRVALALAAAAPLILAAGPLRPALAATELVFFAEPGCAWCAAWEEQIGVVYDRTEEGRRAPLRRVDMTAERPRDLAAIEGIRFSPTFVLMDGGAEIGRIVGYPGEHFFWPMLQELLARLGRDPGRSS